MDAIGKQASKLREQVAKQQQTIRNPRYQTKQLMEVKTHAGTSSKDDWKYDVFLSFGGEDTRRTFTDHLYCTLKAHQFNVFMYEYNHNYKLDSNGTIAEDLVQEIERSKVAVVVFSKGYAASAWCLEELVKIMECRKTLGQIFLPILYDVDPSDVTYQTGSFAEAFQKHEQKIKEKKVHLWINALKEAGRSAVFGFRKTDGNEGIFIRDIIAEITRRLRIRTRLELEVPTNLVGMGSREREIRRHLDVGGSNDVRIIGILGMCGLGKTTVAKVIFNRYHRSFDGASFLQIAREKKLVDLQEQLSAILKPAYVVVSSIDEETKEIVVSSIDEGTKEIERRLGNRRVLVVIDDLDSVEQLDALAIKPDSFGSGSRIIIISRNKHLLTTLEVDEICSLPSMGEREALELLCWHAFRRNYPDEEYVELSRKAVGYCGGLPLALEVLGSYLRTKSTSEWETELDKWKRHPPWEILEKIKTSYDALPDDDVKSIFLDISCFFTGMNKDYVMTVLDGCQFYPEIGIRELQDRCLVTVDRKGNLMMHDLIQGMGREIVRTESPDNPGKRSRLWHNEDITDVLTNESGTEEVEGLALDMQESDKRSFSSESFRNMQSLRLLKLNNIKLNGSYHNLSEELRWLCWHGFPLEGIPKDFDQPNLVAIDLSYSKLIRVWEDSDLLLDKLKLLNLSHSHYLARTPDFSKLPNLEELILNDCESLSEVHSSIGNLERLSLVNLEGCKNLHAIPNLPKNLKVLRAGLCTALETMPNFSELSNMRELYLSHSCKLTEIPGLVMSLNLMTRIHMEGCINLTADFRKNILQGWTSCGYGGIFLNGNYIPDWFDFVKGDRVSFHIPLIVGRNFSGLTLCCIYSSKKQHEGPLGIIVSNKTKRTALLARITYASVPTSCKRDDHYLWQGHLSNHVLSLQGGDKVDIFVKPVETADASVRVEKIGVNLVWDKLMKENIHDSDFRLYVFDQHPDWSLGADGYGGISRELKSNYLDVTIHSVGIDSRVQEISNYLDVGGSNDVRIIGICGMGGLGKTTVAKVIFNKYQHMFDGRSFLPNVREDKKMVYSQNKLLSDILRSGNIKVGRVVEGTKEIKRRLGNKRVLVIVDDVDRDAQLDALAINHDSFGPGSRIIITTRDQHLLEMLNVEAICPVQEMNKEEALELLSWHAFRKNFPNEEYVELSRKAVDYCGGLPLALEVLGSYLRTKSTSEWKMELDKWKRSQPYWEILKKIKTSYDRLNDDLVKDVFLDIGCFFIGMNKNYVMTILDGCDLHPEIGIRELQDQCLVTVDTEGNLMMHDLIRDMAREIVHAQCPDHSGERSRLWHHVDVIDVLGKQSGTVAIEGLALDLKGSDDSIFSTEAFRKMRRLRLLKLNYVNVTGSHSNLSKELRWLCWHGFPPKVIPEDFDQPNLVAIDLSYSKLIRVWEDTDVLRKNLKIINLSHSHYLTESPDFSKVPNLEKLILVNCRELSSIHPSIGHLERLSLVNLEDCQTLRYFPRDFYKSRSVETLILNGCSRFRRLNDSLGEMVSLTTLQANRTMIRQVPSSIVRLKNLRSLSLCDVRGLPSRNLLPPSLHGLNSLTFLGLRNCNLTDVAIPKDLGSLFSLEILELDGNLFYSLPSLSGLSKLKMLGLSYCKDLHEIPDLPTSLEILRANQCIALEKMPNFSEMSSMVELHLNHSPKLTEIQGLHKSLNAMRRIHMEGCTNLTADFRKNILQGWTSCGYGGIFLNGIYDIPEWFQFVAIDEPNDVHFKVPQIIGRNFTGLTVCCVFKTYCPGFTVTNITKGKALHIGGESTRVANSVLRLQSGLSNDVLHLQSGDEVSISAVTEVHGRVMKTGVNLVWDKSVKENIMILTTGWRVFLTVMVIAMTVTMMVMAVTETLAMTRLPYRTIIHLTRFVLPNILQRFIEYNQILPPKFSYWSFIFFVFAFIFIVLIQ